MGKIKETFQKMSLKKSLIILTVFCLSLVGVFSSATILKCSDIRQEILDTRPIIITGYTTDNIHEHNTETESGMIVTPKIYTHGELWCLYPWHILYSLLLWQLNYITNGNYRYRLSI